MSLAGESSVSAVGRGIYLSIYRPFALRRTKQSADCQRVCRHWYSVVSVSQGTVEQSIAGSRRFYSANERRGAGEYAHKYIHVPRSRRHNREARHGRCGSQSRATARQVGPHPPVRHCAELCAL